MSVEVLLLVVIAGLTLLAYMIAINAHGPTRLGISYLLATLMLAGTVWVVVQHVNAGLDIKRRQELEALGQKNQVLSEQLADQEREGAVEQRRRAVAAKLSGVVSEGKTLSSRMVRVDMQDRSVDFDGLVGRAVVAIKSADELKDEYEKIKSPDRLFPDAAASIEEALKLLKDAAHYYRSFYSSEDADQEELRARIMRQKARSASDLFEKAGSQLSVLK
jgi:hypothetical protein